MSRLKSEVYFYLKEGKVTGPIYVEDVRLMIESGELTPMELLYCEAEKVWKPVGEFEELQLSEATDPSVNKSQNLPPPGEEVTPVKGASESAKDSFAWVVLKKKPQMPSQYLQLGPMPTSQVYDLIARGELGFHDFVWRDGYSEWVPIARDKSFQDRISFRGEEKPKLPVVPGAGKSEAPQQEIEEKAPAISDDDVDKILRESEETAESVREFRPQEAEGPNLADIPGSLPEALESLPVEEEVLEPRGSNSKEQLEEVSEEESSAEEESVSPVVDGESEKSVEVEKTTSKKTEEYSQKVHRGQFARWLLLTFNLVLLCGILGLFVYGTFGPTLRRYFSESTVGTPEKSVEKKRTTPSPRKKVAKEVNQESDRKPSPTPPPRSKKTAVKKEEPKIRPTYIRVKSQKLSTSNPVLRFSSDGSSHYLLEFELRGRPGAVLTLGSYRRLFRIPLKDRLRSLNLSSARVPDGEYSYVAKIGGLVRRGRFFKGIAGARFRESRFRIRKGLSPRHQGEKLKMIYEAQKLKEFVEALKAVSLKGFKRSQQKIQLRRDLSRWLRRLNFVFSSGVLWHEEWQKLAEAGEELKALERKLPSKGALPRDQISALRALSSKVKKSVQSAEQISLF